MQGTKFLKHNLLIRMARDTSLSGSVDPRWGDGPRYSGLNLANLIMF